MTTLLAAIWTLCPMYAGKCDSDEGNMDCSRSCWANAEISGPWTQIGNTI